jgi:hypothetical protein
MENPLKLCLFFSYQDLGVLLGAMIMRTRYWSIICGKKVLAVKKQKGG